jgi:A/G-specific adenine glycosylase
MAKSTNRTKAVTDLLAWYDSSARVLPWRSLPGETPDPYHVWLSEIMLQQTTVATVGPYFRKFLDRWPRIEDLAAAKRDDVLANWAGLGYYARARNLHKCAGEVADRGGVFPDTEAGLQDLPGIGPYTAAAIAAIAFNQPVVPLDGNIERVTARWFALTTPLPDVKPELRKKAQAFTHRTRPGDVAQALMDLGATICKPKLPVCNECPISRNCDGHAKEIAADLPKRAPKKQRPTRYSVVFWLENQHGQVLLQQRPDKGLLGGMLGLPSTDWTVADWTEEEAQSAVPARSKWLVLPGSVGHTFTHFHLEMTVWMGETKRTPREGEIWLLPENLKDHAVPTLFRKVARHATTQVG